MMEPHWTTCQTGRNLLQKYSEAMQQVTADLQRSLSGSLCVGPVTCALNLKPSQSLWLNFCCYHTDKSCSTLKE